MKLFYSYMERLRVHLINVTSLFLSITPAINGHKMVYVRQVLFVLPFCFIVFSYAHAQSAQERAVAGQTLTEPLIVGQKVPDEFWEREQLFYINGDTVRKSLEEHKGKLLVLDFWSTSCASCLFHQKEIDSFKSAYKKDMNVIMVNPIKTKDNIDRIKTFYQNHYVLKSGSRRHFESIILDDSLHRIFQFSGYPHYIWINKEGYVQTQTFRNLLDRNYVAPFIDRDL